MKVYHLHRKQILPLDLGEAWSFFTSPHNLVKITPAYMDFKILHTSGDEKNVAYRGQIITYKIKLFPLIYTGWTTEITHVEPGKYFIDEQRLGPYALWHHEHRFREVPGGVEMTDEIAYAIPFGIIGRIAHWLFVKNQLNTIFAYRYNVLDEIFSPLKKQKTELV